MKTLKILIVDDHEMIRKGLRSVLEEQQDITICGEARNGREAITKARELKPNVVVMDYTMPELNGRDATRRIRKELPKTEVLMLTMHKSEELARQVKDAGAKGFILKNQAANVLVEAIHTLANHKPFFPARLGLFAVKGYLNEATKENPTLTPREREIVQLVAEGKSNKEVAVALGISTKTAETHRTNIMRKLDLHSAGDLVRYAIRNHLVEP